MRVLIVGNSANPGAVEDGLAAAGTEVERRPDGSDTARGPDEIGAIARELREFEHLLGENGPDAVLVASDSSASLAAVLVATKLGTPVAGIEPPGGWRRERAPYRTARRRPACGRARGGLRLAPRYLH